MSLLAAVLLTLTAPLAYAQPVADTKAAAVDQAAAAAQRDYIGRLAETLAAEGSARGLAHAAWLRDWQQALGGTAVTTTSHPQARAWRELALQRAGTDTVVLAMLAGADDPSSAQAVTRWRQLAPGNLVPVLFAGLEPEPLLAAAARTSHAQGHTIEQLRWIVDAVRRSPPAPDTLAQLVPDGVGIDGFAVMHGWAYLATFATPDFATLVEACRAAGQRGADAAEACGNAARVLQGGDTRLQQMVGTGLAGEVATNASDRQRAETARRRLDWQMYELGRLTSGQPDQGLAEHAALLADPALDSEAALNEAQLRRAGIPLDPPAGWQPPPYR
ncbi:hypothetical protein E4582_13540 [Luteimonas yindakuii]|uniref:Secreted protein n=1 Tax=Luteimonas yindakuii TaxID=2565782 RepID=A0A4Z1R946_9GAMM|nr:hypothetical protein [Luteimonas yindakuii]TKS53198.1 hypothetical protein E4582_13540 [Luteimonas yindakuii]